ncbi:MAG TPA: alanine--tRNA ligase [Planctomycetota bacterium]|nr:alanine--tRNA ligase [Planctomycetota bacterium]
MITLDEIRERYLDFFKKRGHTVYPSDSLVPPNDPSLLFTGAGMNQFKDMFLGRGTLPFKRATTSQKCLRTGDLEAVGRTSRHHTFFEMLGNFSFGDYFKREAITWAWEFATKEMGISPERLFISVYKDDPEAYKIWNEEIGIPAGRLSRLGEGDNFWPANAPSQGPNGPCGPCSEIYYDYGPQYGCGSPDCSITCGCNRYVEIWNLVFTQFDRQDGGVLQPLPQKNIDTGAGLERWASVLQGVHSNFETDVFMAIIGAESHLLGLTYSPGTEQSSRMRRIADHVRALTFCIADNALPGNTGRNYVVRRILRTALRDGVQLGHNRTFLHRLVPAVVAVMKKGYPYLLERQKTVEQVIKAEEEKFLDTLEKGNELITEEIAKLRKGGKDTMPGEMAFKLYDTFGFPIEMTEQILRDQKLKLDRKRFEEIMEGRSEGNRKSGEIIESGPFADFKFGKQPKTEFLGYQIPVAELGKPQDASVKAIFKIKDRTKFDKSRKSITDFTTMLNKDSDSVDSAAEGATVAVVLDRTPLYGEGGGQAGDAGTITGEATVAVDDCRKPDDYYMHFGKVTKGTLKVGAKVKVAVDAERRLNIMRNHTGTHLLQAALRAVLGNHVTQAGSVVEADRLRFDFSHYQAMTPEEIRKVEDWVNNVVFTDQPVTKLEMTKDEATASGAIAFFGEKYGDRVRVVTVGPKLSVEFCGGTHLEHASTIGALRITSESSIGSGIRRIEAVTGPRVVELGRSQEALLGELSKLLKSPAQDVPKKVQKLLDEVQKLKSTGGLPKGGDLAEWGGAGDFTLETKLGPIVAEVKVKKTADSEELRGASDQFLSKNKKVNVLLLVSQDGAFVLRTRPAEKGPVDANKITAELKKQHKARGGGKPDFVQGTFPQELAQTLDPQSLETLVKKVLQDVAW